VTLNTGRGAHRKYRPIAFTEHGAIMAATILNSPRAEQMSVYVVRAFVKLRESLVAHTDLARGGEEAVIGLSKMHNLIRLPCRHIISQEPT